MEGDPLMQLEVAERAQLLTSILNILTPRQRKVIELRYGLVDGVPLSLKQIGAQFQPTLTRQKIWQIEEEALQGLRKDFQENEQLGKGLRELYNPALP